MSATFAQFPVERWRAGKTTALDTIATEVPVAFAYNGIAHTVMLATPADLEDFALGFSLSEGIVDHYRDVFAIETVESAAGITLDIRVAGDCFARLKERRRSLAGRTGCGLCGAESLSQVRRALAPVPAPQSFDIAALYAGMRQLPQQQVLQQTTGAAHAACWVGTDGTIAHVREDIGRHNALDKTLGALLRAAGTSTTGALVITSRASFEMVQKAAALGFGILAAVSAPTAAAVQLAQTLGLTLVGFLREETCVVYSHGDVLQEK